MAAADEPSSKHYFSNGKAGATPQGEEQSVDDPLALAILAALAGSQCVRLFVAGAVTHVGKTSVCLSILAALRRAGLKAEELAYIKPATQCEAPDLLARWCAAEGIEHVAGEHAPLVFYAGFTRSFLAGEQGTSAQWLAKITARADELAEGRRVLVVDGVGFPAVGSIVGVDNADVAKAARAPVLLVCKCGVGAAVDSFSLNSTYFLAKGVPVLGAVFNLGDLEGSYAWEQCAENIELWFSQRPSQRERCYGVIPLVKELDGLRERIPNLQESELQELAQLNASHFAAHADLPALLGDAAADAWCRRGTRRQPAPTKTVPTKTAPSAFQPPTREAVEKAFAVKKAGG